MPESNVAFWTEKFRSNTERDGRVHAALEAEGWEVLVVWECETRNLEELASRLTQFLDAATGAVGHPTRAPKPAKGA